MFSDMQWLTLGSPQYNQQFGQANDATGYQPPQGQFQIMPSAISNMIQQAGGIGDPSGGRVDNDGNAIQSFDQNGQQVTQQDLLNQKLAQLGISRAVSPDGQHWAYVDSSGQPIQGTVDQGADPATGFWNAALLAGAVAGGAAGGAFGGAGGAEAGGGGGFGADLGGGTAFADGTAYTGGAAGGELGGGGVGLGGMDISAGAGGFGGSSFGGSTGALDGLGAAGGGGALDGSAGLGAGTLPSTSASTPYGLSEFNPNGITSSTFGQNADFAGALGGGGGVGSSLIPGVSNGSLLNFGGSLANGLLGSNAAGKSTDALVQAGQQSNALQQSIYNQSRADFAPYLAAGTSALGQIQQLLANPNSITTQPGYQFGLDQGTKTLNNGAAARGMTYSGAQGRALQRYGNDYASTKLNDSFNRLASVAGIGQTATNASALTGQNFGQSVGNTLQGMGSSRASGYIGGANAWAGAGNSLVNNYNQGAAFDQYANLLKQLNGGG